MSDDPTQETPSGEERRDVFGPENKKAGKARGGLEIPVPEKDDVMAALRKVAKAGEPCDDESS